MAFFIKGCGMVLLLVSCTLAGFRKAAWLQRRVRVLDEIDAALEELAQRLQSDGRERNALLTETFGKRGLLSSQTVLSAEDRSMLTEFLSTFGGGDPTTEQKRIALCRSLFHERRNAAKSQADERARLYKVIGICVGCAGCLFWL